MVEPARRAAIADRLDRVEEAHDLAILYACESGSRAWGFPSTDSDYDVRFVYVHSRDWYLSIDLERRDDTLAPSNHNFVNGRPHQFVTASSTPSETTNGSFGGRAGVIMSPS